MKKILLLFLCVSVTTIYAQKKLTPATKSTVTGIDLPTGSKQDGRLLSQSMAGFLMDTESDKRKTTLRTAEVLVLPPASLSKFNKDSLVQRLSAKSWKIIATEGDNYLWLQKEKSFVIAYFSIETKGVNLYFAEAIATPDFSAQAENTTSQPAAQPVTEPAAKAVVLPVAPPVNQSPTQPVTQTTQNKTTNTSINSPIVGIWRRGTGVSLYGGRWSSTGYQYIFNANGTYTYVIKTYVEGDPETLLTRESGIFTINGNTVTLDPKTNVIEAWSKPAGFEGYKDLISSQNKPLEKITYQFTPHFFPELKETGLVLIYGKETIRDGKYNASDAFPTGWRFSPAGPDYKPIKLPGEQPTTEEVKKEPAQQNAPLANGKFAFSTTTFDDGWVSTVQEDWVEVKKGSMKVLLRYPKEGTIFPADPGPMTNAAWDILVAPRYSNLKNYKTTYITTYERPYLGMGYATENVTGKNVFIVFFHRGQTGWLEFIAPDKNTFIQHYKFDPETIQWDSNEDLMIPLTNMIGYNRFAVAASDLKGKWTSDFSGIQQLYNVYTGQYAGMNINQSKEEFIFNPDNSYNWKLLVVNGVVGNMKANEVKSSGQFNVPTNWQVYFSKIETGPRTFHAFWSCIKGARLLNLLDANVPGSGIYTKYGLAK
ncbi:MAG: PT domain-containing protein [Cyclobacteriaceae bacterium]